jgi:hypothetical protein
MVEISSSGSSEGPGRATGRGYSTVSQHVNGVGHDRDAPETVVFQGPSTHLVPYGKGANAGEPTYDVNTTGTFMNRTLGFQTLLQAYDDYQPIRQTTVTAPDDPRTDGTQQMYFAQPWGANSIFFNLDDCSYRDIRLKTPGGADDERPSRPLFLLSISSLCVAVRS